MSHLRTMAVLLAGAMLVSLPLATGCDKSEPVDEAPATDENGEADTTPATDATPEDEAGEPATPPAADGSAAEVPPNAPATMTVRLYWVEAGENALGIERTLTYSPAVGTAAMNALLAGPTAAEQTTWPAISSTIPAGTKLLGLTVADGIARVDLSKEFESGGGTFSVTARLAQVVYTLEQFPTVDAVEFYIEGVKVEMFSSEGLILDGPQTLDDYDELLPIDA